MYIAGLMFARVILPPKRYVQLFVWAMKKIQPSDQILEPSQSP